MNSKVSVRTLTTLLAAISLPLAIHAADTAIPHLRAQGSATQLIVDGQPLLMRGGELGNSTATNPAYLRPYWPKLKALNLNTLLVPATWDQIEPTEGTWDFSGVDEVVAQARANGMKLVLLWFGSWKNSMSCYAPAWVKRDTTRFPRAADQTGAPQEILTPFSETNRDTDARAFAALLRHLAQTDGQDHTVVMIQVENEIGMIPSARDHSEPAERAYASAVPKRLMDALARSRETLAPEVRDAWTAAGAKTAGTWSEVFGPGPAADEIFMAWHFAQYTEAVAAAGKREYPLPMFVNAALIRPGHRPGQYPSAGPLPHLHEIWRAAAPSIDFLSPDIYFQNFVEWVRRYHRPGNPLFIPEAMRGPEASVNGLYAFGGHDAMGFSPFGIEKIGERPGRWLADSFDLIRQLEPLILAHQGLGTMAGLLSEGAEQRQPQQVILGEYVLNATFERGVPADLAEGAIVASDSSAAPVPPPSGGLVIALAPDEFVIAGTALIVTFAPREGRGKAGLLTVEEGRFSAGTWENIRWLSGDETHQGRHVRLEPGRFSMQRVKLYRY